MISVTNVSLCVGVCASEREKERDKERWSFYLFCEFYIPPDISRAVMKQKLLGGGTAIKRGQAASAGSL